MQPNCWNNNTVQQTHGTALTVKKSHQQASCSASLLFVSSLFVSPILAPDKFGAPLKDLTFEALAVLSTHAVSR